MQMDEARLRKDDVRQLKLFTETFGAEMWHRTIIGFTKANLMRDKCAALQAPDISQKVAGAGGRWRRRKRSWEMAQRKANTKWYEEKAAAVAKGVGKVVLQVSKSAQTADDVEKVLWPTGAGANRRILPGGVTFPGPEIKCLGDPDYPITGDLRSGHNCWMVKAYQKSMTGWSWQKLPFSQVKYNNKAIHSIVTRVRRKGDGAHVYSIKTTKHADPITVCREQLSPFLMREQPLYFAKEMTKGKWEKSGSTWLFNLWQQTALLLLGGMSVDIRAGGMIHSTAYLPSLALLKAIPDNIIASGVTRFTDLMARFKTDFDKAKQAAAKEMAESADCGTLDDAGSPCFPGDATVRLATEQGVPTVVRMADLKVGDMILTVDPSVDPVAGGGAASAPRRYRATRVYAFLHREADATYESVAITTESGTRLRLSPEHLVHVCTAAEPAATMVMTATSTTTATTMMMAATTTTTTTNTNTNTTTVCRATKAIRARDVTTTHTVVVAAASAAATTHADAADADRAERVQTIERVQAEGAYAPLTMEGTQLVDGILASNYAEVDSEAVAHATLFPLRMASVVWPEWAAQEKAMAGATGAIGVTEETETTQAEATVATTDRRGVSSGKTANAGAWHPYARWVKMNVHGLLPSAVTDFLGVPHWR